MSVNHVEWRPERQAALRWRYAQEQGLPSRSAAMHKAVRLLRAAELGADYEHAWAEWESSHDADAWERTAGDGLTA